MMFYSGASLTEISKMLGRADTAGTVICLGMPVYDIAKAQEKGDDYLDLVRMRTEDIPDAIIKGGGHQPSTRGDFFPPTFLGLTEHVDSDSRTIYRGGGGEVRLDVPSSLPHWQIETMVFEDQGQPNN
jgi:hypothetical protein